MKTSLPLQASPKLTDNDVRQQQLTLKAGNPSQVQSPSIVLRFQAFQSSTQL